jgi:hypothetical protein
MKGGVAEHSATLFFWSNIGHVGMEKEYNLGRDPVFFATVAFFALLTTGLPMVLGQFRFLPLVQAVALAALLLVPLRRRDLRSALVVAFLWLALTMATVFVYTWFDAVRAERALEDGFMYRAAFAEWYYANAQTSLLPASFATQPLASIGELVGILLGSLLTAGFVGAWFLMKMANLAAFGAASLTLTLPNPLWMVVGLPLWSILQIIGAGGLLVLLAEPLASGKLAAGLRELGRSRRLPLLLFGGMFVLGILLELVLPPFWHFTLIP